MIAKWLSECWEAAMSRCAFRLLSLLHRLNSPPLPSLLSSHPCSSLLPVWSLPLFPAAAAHPQTILEEDLEDPVYQVTSWPIPLLLSPAAFLASQLAPLCVHCGETAPVWVDLRNKHNTRCLGVCRCIQRASRKHSYLCVHESVAVGAWLAERCVCFLSCSGYLLLLKASSVCHWDLFFNCFLMRTYWQCCLTNLLCSFLSVSLSSNFLPASFFPLSFPCCWRCSTLCLRRDTSPSVTNQKRAFIRYPQAHLVCLCLM